MMKLLLVGLAGYAAWRNRDRLSDMARKLQDRAGGPGTTERVPSDYNWKRPSVFNSTAMAGPVDSVGSSSGLDGGSMGTDLGTQGEGAR